MKTQSIFLIILIGLMISCQQNTTKDSPEELKQVLNDYFDGIKNMDFNKMKDVTTDDFTLYEVGKVWNNDSLINFIKTFPPYKIDYKFDNFNIQIDNSIGYMYYFNHADMVINDTINMVFDWIECATFVKKDNEWKMNFLHSSVRK
ncbi:nuclear transport factor 2 family protein [Tenuifilum osseticum]|uniref:nuclear transport factor 2 family protein n=1 Tax=Tenuifilum osseticum TaxID=3374723 RepID=UPI0034E577B4